jgi:prepilin-type N-terminal cleavage/methylation domain-containing protein
MDRQRQMGFTLYELMITVTVVAVILAFGIPNLRDFTLNGRMTSTANDLHAAFMMARTEARQEQRHDLCQRGPDRHRHLRRHLEPGLRRIYRHQRGPGERRRRGGSPDPPARRYWRAAAGS